MILPQEAIDVVIEKFPDLLKSPYWQYYLNVNDYEDYDLKVCKLMVIFSRYVKDILNEPLTVRNHQKIQEIFSLIEYLVIKGNLIVHGSATSCFLETLINYIYQGLLKPETFVFYLGPESKVYCKDWCEFAGVSAAVLWN